MAARGSPPLGVTIVFVVILITGALSVAAGVWRLFNRGDNNTTLTTALVTIAVGVIYLLVAKGIANGSRAARFIVAAVTVLSLVGYTILLFTTSGLVLTLLIQILLGLIVLGLLYSAAARRFFAG
jgi:hypothetical protein